MENITFVHLTDLHFADPTGPSWLGLDAGQRLQQVLEAIRSMSIQPLCFVVSGDLVNGASAANCEMLRSGLEALDRFGVPVILALGNHDDRSLFRQIILRRRAAIPGHPTAPLTALVRCASSSSTARAGRVDRSRWMRSSSAF